MRLVAVFMFVLILGAGSLYFISRGAVKKRLDKTSEKTVIISKPEAEAPVKATIVYTDEGFSPQKVTIAQGGEVEFVNRSSMPLWVASNPHPEHTDYPEFNTPKILGDRMPDMKDGTRFTFQKVGSWGFHNHTASGDATEVAVHPGTVTVK